MKTYIAHIAIIVSETKVKDNSNKIYYLMKHSRSTTFISMKTAIKN